MKLKANSGRLEVKGLGITLTQQSTSEEIGRALAHMPELKAFIDFPASGKVAGTLKTEKPDATK